MGKKHVSDFCELDLYDTYAILCVFEGQHLDLEKNNWIRAKYDEHFGGKEFVVVANRRFHHTIDLNIYKDGKMKNKKGMAIVSTIAEERERALVEQKLFPHSFAFFNSLESAKSWAQHFF